jgi:hypothetical protein
MANKEAGSEPTGRTQIRIKAFASERLDAFSTQNSPQSFADSSRFLILQDG